MAVINLDQLLAGCQSPHAFFKLPASFAQPGFLLSLQLSKGVPGAAAAPSGGLGGTALTTYSGQLPFTNPGSGNSYLGRLVAHAGNGGRLLLVDRLWHNSGITITTTTGQTINSATWPARDANGLTNGTGVLVGIEAVAATGNGGIITNTTLTYTNSVGTGSRTATMTVPGWPASAVIGQFVPFSLASGDLGVRSIQTLTLGTSYVSGTIALVAYRILASIVIPKANSGGATDALTSGLVRLYDNTVPTLLFQSTVAATADVRGSYSVIQG